MRSGWRIRVLVACLFGGMFANACVWWDVFCVRFSAYIAACSFRNTGLLT